MRRLSVLVTLLAILIPGGSAEAVSVRDVIELTRARLSEAIILELIAVDQTIYSLDAAKIVELREAGVSEQVILAMIRSGRNTPAAAPAPEQTSRGESAPTVIVIERQPSVEIGATAYGGRSVVGGYANYGVFESWRHNSIVIPVPIFGYPWYGHTVQSVPAPTAGLDATAGFGRFMNDGYRPAPAPPTSDAKPVYWGWGGQLRPGAWSPSK
jgi:hypothetical protein